MFDSVCVVFRIQLLSFHHNFRNFSRPSILNIKRKLEITARVNLVALEGEEPDQEIVESRRFQHHENGSQNVGETYCCAFSPDEKLLAWSKGDGFVEVVHFSKFSNTSLPVPQNGEQILDRNWYKEIDCVKKVLVMEFKPMTYDLKGRKYVLATGLDCGRVKLWDPYTKDMLLNLSDHRVDVKGLSFAQCGEPLLITCSIDKTLKVWDLADEGNMTLTIKGHPLPISDCSFSPTDSSLICSVGKGRSVFVWKLQDKRTVTKFRQLKGHHNDVSSCSWSPDGALVATASYDTTVIIWDPHNGTKVMELGHMNPPPEPIFAGGSNGAWLTSVCFSPDGSRVATLCEDERLRIWSLWSDKPIEWKLLHGPGPFCRFSPSGSAIAVGEADGSVSILDVKVSVMPLRHLSRLALRRSSDPARLRSLPLPSMIKKYVQYLTSRY